MWKLNASSFFRLFAKPAEFDYDAVKQRMLTQRPRCLLGFVVDRTDRPEPWEDEDVVTWRLCCPCGCAGGALLGHPVSRFNPDYQGAEFLGPLSFQCFNCGRVIGILDTRQHGYHGELGSNTHYCGEGQASSFVCPNCSKTRFVVLVSLFFWPAAMDLVEDEPGKYAAYAENLFNQAIIHGRCVGCEQLAVMAAYDKL
jgi:hypothetical protein